MKEAEKEKLDRISPASSAPDSPPESERRDSASSTHEEITEFTTAAQRAADDAYWQTEAVAYGANGKEIFLTSEYYKGHQPIRHFGCRSELEGSLE